MHVNDIARVAHEVNRAYCESLGDFSQQRWEDAPQWQKDSAISGVEFHMFHPEVTPEWSHENWCNQKLEDGWQYGEVKNPETKEHPCLVPYVELPQEQKSKDYIFTAVVRALLAA